MSSGKEDALSPDELRKRLYQTFKSKGVLDTLKTQLRNQLIQELKHPPLTGGPPVPRPVPVKSEPRLVSACNSIVADHLLSSGYEYTLSVFYPESGLCKDKVSTKEDLLQLLSISPESALYRSLSLNKGNSDKGFLISLLTQLTHHYTHGLHHDADTQTASTANYGESLVEKMKMIDKEYEGFSYSGDRYFSFQSKLAAYRKEVEAQMQADMKTKMEHFKDVEMAKVRIEEQAKFHKEVDKLKQELERTYEMKTRALMDREKNAIDRLQKQQEIEEKNVYMQRQSVLKEIETLRNRENELRMRTEAFEKTCQIHEQKVKTTEELLRRRELAVKTLEDTYDQRLQNELSRYQLELKDEFIKRTEKLTENESRNKLETARIQKESAVIDAKLEEHSRACSELRRLQVEVDTAQRQISLLTQQNELLRERLETMSDYPSLKREKAELQGQLRLLKKQLEEAQEENQLLHTDLGKPSKEQLAMQMELRRLHNAHRLDEEEFDNQKQVLQAQLQSEVERCAQLKAQLIEYEEKSQWMTNHIEDIKTQLRQTQQALENEVLRNPKPSLVDRSVLELSADKLVPPDIYMDRALLRARGGHDDDVCQTGGPLRGHKSPWSDSPDSDLELVAEAKARIQELQKEAETLEEAYRNYQQRAVRTTVSHMLPPRPLSPQQAHPSHRSDAPLRKQISHRSRPHSPHKSAVSHRPPSPQTTRTPSSVPYDTKYSPPPEQPRVTFSEERNQPHATVFRDHSLQSFVEPLCPRDGHTWDESSPPSRRLSSTPHSSSRKSLQREIAEEAVVSPIAFLQLTSDGQLPRAPRDEAATSGDFPSELTPPRSPQLKSTVREQSSPPKLQMASSSSESSPQPEKISLEDLTGILSEPGHIPELLLDTAVPLSEEAPDGPTVPRPQDLPEDPIDLQGKAEVSQTSDLPVREEDEEQRWERERKERQERRQQEQEEARERELQELERLEKEMLLQEVEQPVQEKDEEEEEIGIEKGGDEEKKHEAENDKEEPQAENPLEKYMKMVLEARGKQLTQSSGREEMGHTSPEAKSLSEEKDNSIAAYSHKDEDDDFW